MGNRYFRQSAAIPFYQGKIVLVRNRNNQRWIIPKGMIKSSYTPRASASLEALEEGGIKGKVRKKKVGTYTYRKNGETYNVLIYIMDVEKLQKTWKEENFRRRKVMSVQKAVKRVYPKTVAKIIDRHLNETKKRKKKKKK